MIVQYIIAIIMFVFQIYILKHTHYVKEKATVYKESFDQHLQPIKVPVYVVLLMLICVLIPFAWIVSTIAFWVFWISRYCDSDDSYATRNSYTYYRLKDSFLMKSI